MVRGVSTTKTGVIIYGHEERSDSIGFTSGKCMTEMTEDKIQPDKKKKKNNSQTSVADLI